MGYSVINPQHQNEAIKRNWKDYHIINIVLLSTALPCWFFTPFLTRDTNNNWHKFFRFSSITYALIASGTSLYLSNQLGKLKPKIDAINKREQAEFKHSLASDLYLAQSTNTAIAQHLVIERQVALTPITEVPESYILERPDPRVHGEFPESIESSQSSRNSELSTNGTETELERNLELFAEPILKALEDGLTDSEIVKDVMGFKGRRYAEGKTILNDIKEVLELSED